MTEEPFEPFEPGHDERERHRTAMQAVIIELAERSGGRPVPEVVADLERSLAAQGLPQQPHSWVMAVAQDAANGHAYVESYEAVRDAEEMVHPGHESDTHPSLESWERKEEESQMIPPDVPDDDAR
ncbi:hypothetical protein [Phycicoccus sp. SLBN-51]|jgi:hypothetical protein|uniref:hypothetical protein n=1 Tax=Phycicoccus sp. SLBN-51 TaxID=2768447 RepID=UPI0011682E63|nr:hypothetical protein [Phycicoccus sp. SLBN-51]TQJ49514.1 hypothetical protein FBY26_1199 [Phycicoccus sp. SLBN-51]